MFFSELIVVKIYHVYELGTTTETLFELDLPEVESSRTSLASRTHFEVLGLEGQVLGLGLEASSPRILPSPRLENSTIF